jgi:hypothetical protein
MMASYKIKKRPKKKMTKKNNSKDEIMKKLACEKYSLFIL